MIRRTIRDVLAARLGPHLGLGGVRVVKGLTEVGIQRHYLRAAGTVPTYGISKRSLVGEGKRQGWL